MTGGYWFDAEVTLDLVDRFAMGPIPGHEASCEWLTQFLRLYRPVIATVLSSRDRRLARYRSREGALESRRLEVLSAVEIDWLADLDVLGAEARRRGVVVSSGPDVAAA